MEENKVDIDAVEKKCRFTLFEGNTIDASCDIEFYKAVFQLCKELKEARERIRVLYQHPNHAQIERLQIQLERLNKKMDLMGLGD